MQSASKPCPVLSTRLKYYTGLNISVLGRHVGHRAGHLSYIDPDFDHAGGRRDAVRDSDSAGVPVGCGPRISRLHGRGVGLFEGFDYGPGASGHRDIRRASPASAARLVWIPTCHSVGRLASTVVLWCPLWYPGLL